MLPEVRAGFPAFTARFEGRIAWMYCDIKGLVTTGVGNLIDPIGLAIGLPWLRPDGSRASEDEIRAEWARVKAMGGGLVASRYRSDTGLHLDDDAIDALVLSHLDGDAQVLAVTFPDFPTFPGQAQTAILSMSWAMGAGFPARWPLFSAAVRARDWARCAATCAINAKGNPGVAPRNDADRQLFLQAADIESGVAPSSTPVTDAADTNADVTPTPDDNNTPAPPDDGDDNVDDSATQATPATPDAGASSSGGGALGLLAAASLALAAGWYWRRQIAGAFERVSTPPRLAFARARRFA
jgi:GH24 family phage-related lysozyme (muramidase)